MKTAVFAFVLLYKDSPNNRVHFGFYCIHIMVIFKHVFLLSLFWMRIRMPLWHPPSMRLDWHADRPGKQQVLGDGPVWWPTYGPFSTGCPFCTVRDTKIETSKIAIESILKRNIYQIISIIRVWWEVWRREYTESTGFFFCALVS